MSMSLSSPSVLRALAVNTLRLLSLLAMLTSVLQHTSSTPQQQSAPMQQQQQHPYDYFLHIHREQQLQEQHQLTQQLYDHSYPGHKRSNDYNKNDNNNDYYNQQQHHQHHHRHDQQLPDDIERHLPKIRLSKWEKFWDENEFKYPHVYLPQHQPPPDEDPYWPSQPQRWIIYLNGTARPFLRGPGLPLPMPNTNPPKCMREVPAVFFQHEKDVPIVGNSTLNPAFNLVEVCCQGYKRYDYDWSRCVPDCGERCQQNSFCLAGGICKCFDEFVLNHRYECVSTCPLGCENGICYLNGTCICRRGYELDPTKKYCVPLCDPACGHNEECVQPDRCECVRGYARSPLAHVASTSAGHVAAPLGCQPVCIPDCGYGHCVRPNTCSCFPGYQKRINGTICEDNCYMRCENGFCANRTNCVCQSGYRYDLNTTSCLPDCGDNCENGVCTSPGNCRCFDGYERNGPKCSAVCERGCGFYGKCIAPDKCGCAVVDGPLRSFQRCDFGYCNAKGRCRCEQGKTRFIDQCLSPDEVTTYATIRQRQLNRTLSEEFNLLIGQHFLYRDMDERWKW